MRVTLRRLVSSHTNLRTETVEGYAANKPTVGEPFEMWAVPLDNPAAFLRQIVTSPVAILRENGANLTFTTRNNTYELEVHNDHQETDAHDRSDNPSPAQTNQNP